MIGVILAGGQNKRMKGHPKALLPVDGEAMIERQVRVMRRVCTEIIIVTNDPDSYEFLLEDDRIQIIADHQAGLGPLGGIISAMRQTVAMQYWVVACDMPYIDDQAAKLLQTHMKDTACDAVVPVLDGSSHPLHAIYSPYCLPVIEWCLQHGKRSMKEMLRMVHTEYLNEASFKRSNLSNQFAMNINTPEEYQEVFGALNL